MALQVTAISVKAWFINVISQNFTDSNLDRLFISNLGFLSKS